MKEKAGVPHTPFVSMILPTANRFQSAIYSARAAPMQRKLPLPYAPSMQPFFKCDYCDILLSPTGALFFSFI